MLGITDMSQLTTIQARLVPMFFHKLSAMLVAGISLESALMDLEKHSAKKQFKGMVSSLRASTAQGNPLSVSMQSFPEVFLPMHVTVIQSAEAAGRTPETLEDIALSIDQQVRLRRKIIMAMIYPAVALGIGCIVAVLMLIFVLPAFQSMYDGFDAELPRPTLFLLAVRNAVVHYGLYVALGVGAVMFVLKVCRSTMLGKVVADWVSLHAPIAGDLNRKIATVRFARTYSQLLGAGVPIVTALKLAGGAIGNFIAEQVIINAVEQVERGNPLSSAMQPQKIFPDMLGDMLLSGETTGKTDEIMAHLAKMYDEEVSTTVDGLAVLVQPILIVVLGIILGGMIIAILMPWFLLPSIISP